MIVWSPSTPVNTKGDNTLIKLWDREHKPHMCTSNETFSWFWFVGGMLNPTYNVLIFQPLKIDVFYRDFCFVCFAFLGVQNLLACGHKTEKQRNSLFSLFKYKIKKWFWQCFIFHKLSKNQMEYRLLPVGGNFGETQILRFSHKNGFIYLARANFSNFIFSRKITITFDME